MTSMLLLQVTLIFGDARCAPLMESDHWTRPAACEEADAVWERVDSIADGMGWTYADNVYQDIDGGAVTFPCDVIVIPGYQSANPERNP